jgi:hypothetical protein
MTLFRKIVALLTPAKRIVPLTDEERAQKFQQQLHDPGEFVYEEDGFIYVLRRGIEKIHWASIERLAAYKLDLMTMDEVCLDIIWDGRKLMITEETPGWYVFIEKLNATFPYIPEDWDWAVVKPPFATNWTVLYEREDRKMPKSPNFYAHFKGLTLTRLQEALTQKGWGLHRKDKTTAELINSWSEWLMEENGTGVLLHGEVAYHSNNIAILNKLFDTLRIPYQYEFYDDQQNMLYERNNQAD